MRNKSGLQGGVKKKAMSYSHTRQITRITRHRHTVPSLSAREQVLWIALAIIAVIADRA